ncbi:hypothetical protein [Psychroserpens sp. S379A]|uniref:hypothetical protein n=1 Tax=Psychroserpens sp. S379A TaxID=3415137 RepID=UPI003C7DC58F
MKQLFSLVLMMLLVSLHQTKAQNNTNAANETEKKSFQLTFVPPLSTNGSQAHKITNKVSVNLLGGVSNANEAFEFGGLFNVNKSYTKGFQFAGLTNITKAAEKSYQVAGIANIATEGNANFQLSGILQ